MRQLFIMLTFLLSVFSMKAADITSITNAFKGGNASALTTSMDEEVDMAIPGTAKKTNGGEAVDLLKTFFNNNKPSGFNVVHHADKKENGFFVAKLPTASGEFRVNITYRADGDKAIIQSIRIE